MNLDYPAGNSRASCYLKGGRVGEPTSARARMTGDRGGRGELQNMRHENADRHGVTAGAGVGGDCLYPQNFTAGQRVAAALPEDMRSGSSACIRIASGSGCEGGEWLSFSPPKKTSPVTVGSAVFAGGAAPREG